MPQDTTTVALYDSNGNVLSPDSVPQDIQPILDSLMFPVEDKPYHEKYYNDGRDDTYMPFVILFIFILLAIAGARRGKLAEATANENDDSDYVPDDNSTKFLTYYGGELKFTDEELEKVLSKYFQVLHP